MTALALLPAATGFLVVFAFLTFRVNRDVLDTSSSRLTTWSTVALVAVLLVLTATAGTGLVLSVVGGAASSRGLLGLSFMLPIVLFVFLSIRSGLFDSGVDGPDVRAVGSVAVSPLIEKLGLIDIVRVRWSRTDTSPYVKPSFRRATVVLPSSLELDLAQIARSDKEKGTAAKYVLLHELSHVANGDNLVFLVCHEWLTITMWFWVPLHVTLWIATLVSTGWSPGGGAASWVGSVATLIVVHVLPFPILISALREAVWEREYLADARAMLYLADDERTCLSATTTDGVDLAGAVLLYFGLKQRLGWRGTGLTSPIRWKRPVILHPPWHERVAALTAERYLNPIPGMSKARAAAFAGAFGGVIFLYAGLGAGAIAREWLHSSSRPMLPLFAGMLAGTMYVYARTMLVAHRSSFGVLDVRAGARAALTQLVIGTVATSLVVGVGPAAAYIASAGASVVNWRDLLIVPLWIGAIVNVGAVAFVVVSVISYNRLQQMWLAAYDPEEWSAGRRLLLASASTLVGGATLLFVAFYWQHALVGLALAVVGLQLGGRLFLLTDEGAVNRCMVLRMGRRRVRVERPEHYAFLVVGAPVIVVVLVGASGSALAAVAIPPSTNFLGVGVVVLGGFGLTVWLSSRLDVQGSRELRLCSWLAKLSQFCPGTSGMALRGVAQTLGKIRAGAAYNALRPGTGVPSVSDTAKACLALSRVGLRPDERIVRWLGTCENETGGFGPWPRGPSRIGLTRSALQCLTAAGTPPKYRLGHVRWLLGLRDREGGFIESREDRKDLLVEAAVVDALRLLGVHRREELLATASRALAEWRRGRKGVLKTHDMVMIVNGAGLMSPDLTDEIRRCWLVPQARRLASARPLAAIEEAARCFEIADLLMLSEDPDIRQLRSRFCANLEAAWHRNAEGLL